MNVKTIRKYLFFTIIALALVGPYGFSAGDTSKSFQESRITLNPAFKIKRLSNGNVVVSNTQQDGIIVKHEFNELYADLIMAAYRKQRMTVIINNLSKKYYLSQDECRREVKHALNELTEWQIVVRDDQTH